MTIYVGDALEILPTLQSGSMDLVLTDPPYNVGKSYGGHDDNMPPEEYREWCRSWFTECRRIARQIITFPGHGNLPVWWEIARPSGVGCWYKPGNPAAGGVFQWCEWEPWLLWGGRIGGSDVVRATITEQSDTGDHPCPKPLGLFKQLIAKSKAKSVLDPFLGSGTTTRAAKTLGARATGIEINLAYAEIAARRLAQEVLPLEISA